MKKIGNVMPVNKRHGSKLKQKQNQKNIVSDDPNLKLAARKIRPKQKRMAENKPDPNSPFAVLAALKTKT